MRSKSPMDKKRDIHRGEHEDREFTQRDFKIGINFFISLAPRALRALEIVVRPELSLNCSLKLCENSAFSCSLR